MISSATKILFQRAGKAISVRIIAAILAYGLFVVLAQWMNAADFGQFCFAFSTALTLSIFLDLGQRRLVLRHLAAYRGSGQQDQARKLLKFSFGLLLISAATGAVVTISIIWVVGADPIMYGAVALMVMLLLSSYQSYIVRGLGHFVTALAPQDLLWRPVSLVSLSFMGGGISITISPLVAIWTLTFALAALSFLQLVFITCSAWRYSWREEIRYARKHTDSSDDLRIICMPWLITSGRLWVISCLTQGMPSLIVVLVGFFSSPEETGAFFAALRTASLVALPLEAMSLLTSPMIAKIYAADNKIQLQRLLCVASAISGGSALLGAVLLSVIGPFVLSLMTPMYEAAMHIQIIVMVGLVVSAACGAAGPLMTMTGHESAFLWILTICIGFGTVFIVILSWYFGGIGTAVGFAAVNSIWSVAVVVWVRKNLNIDPSVFCLISLPQESK